MYNNGPILHLNATKSNVKNGINLKVKWKIVFQTLEVTAQIHKTDTN